MFLGAALTWISRPQINGVILNLDRSKVGWGGGKKQALAVMDG